MEAELSPIQKHPVTRKANSKSSIEPGLLWVLYCLDGVVYKQMFLVGTIPFAVTVH